MSRYTWKDMGWRKIKGKVAQAGSREIQAGIVGAKGEEMHPTGHGELSVAEIGALMEFGSSTNIPPRPFMKPILVENRSEFLQVCKRAYRRLLEGDSVEACLAEIGVWAVRKIQAKIDSNVAPALSPYTIEKKGHAHALIDSGTLYAAVGFIIVRTSQTVKIDEGGGMGGDFADSIIKAISGSGFESALHGVANLVGGAANSTLGDD